ncbi:DUF6223 family protein [Streptomyces sp. NPDC006430]|uniref:DUF6223 family protein n=1 Tax=Streptomyces sp. NPDC006430 TaxID=3154299 RepID=UPI0033AFBEA6
MQYVRGACRDCGTAQCPAPEDDQRHVPRTWPSASSTSAPGGRVLARPRWADRHRRRWRALHRSWQPGAVVTLSVGLIAMALGGLVAATAYGGLGTGIGPGGHTSACWWGWSRRSSADGP